MNDIASTDMASTDAMLRQSEQAAANNAPLAYQLLASAVLANTNHVEAWWRLGQTHWNCGLRDAAAACYRRALQCPDISDEMRQKVHCNLGHVLFHLGENKEARDHVREAISIDHTNAFNYCNMSLIEGVDGNLDGSLMFAERAFKMDPRNPAIETALAFALLYKRRWTEGLRHFNARYQYRLPQFAQYPYPMWDGSPGKVVYCVGEQGIGDTLSYARFVEAAAKRCDFLHLGVQQELARLFRASFQHIGNINILPQPCPFPPAQAWTTYMSLPTAIGMTDEEFISTSNIAVPKFHKHGNWKDPKAKLHVGIAWSGSAANDINHWRSVPLTEFLRLCKVPHTAFYSLQMDDAAQHIHQLGLAAVIRDMKPHIRDVADTTAILQDLDLVICAEGVLAHIAGTVGVPCWIAYSWMGRTIHVGHNGHETDDGVPFYPKHTVFKQRSDMRWRPVFNEIEHFLRRMVDRA